MSYIVLVLEFTGSITGRIVFPAPAWHFPDAVSGCSTKCYGEYTVTAEVFHCLYEPVLNPPKPQVLAGKINPA